MLLKQTFDGAFLIRESESTPGRVYMAYGFCADSVSGRVVTGF